MTTLYRYVDERGEYHPRVILCSYEVLRETPERYVIRWDGNKSGFKFISKTGRKLYAYLTLEQARNSYKIRKQRQLSYLAQYHDGIKKIVDAIASDRWDFKFDEFGELWPVGTASVVVAANEADARALLSRALIDQGLDGLAPFTLKPLDVGAPVVRILRDGDY